MLKNLSGTYPAPVQYIEKNQNLFLQLANLKQTCLDTQVPKLVCIYKFSPQIKNLAVLALTTPPSGTNLSILCLNILSLSTVRTYSKDYASI